MANVERVQISYSPGLVRQHSLWGKLAFPNGNMYDYTDEKDVDVTIEKKTWTMTFPSLPESTYLVFGARGFYAAGILSNTFILFQVRPNQSSEWLWPGHLSRFESKGAVLVAQSQEVLQPLYDALTAAKYVHLGRLQEMLRKENRDKPPPPKS